LLGACLKNAVSPTGTFTHITVKYHTCNFLEDFDTSPIRMFKMLAPERHIRVSDVAILGPATERGYKTSYSY